MSPTDHREELARALAAMGIVTPADSTAHVLELLAAARERIADLERQLRVLRGERCEHWIDGPDDSRIRTPTYACRWCS